MSVSVHVLGADPILAPHLRRIRAAASAAVERVSRHLPLSDVDVVVERNPFATIPHLGIGGFSPSGHLVHVALDPTHAGFPAVLDLHLSRTLAHELHHCARWRGPGYGRTLGEALVSEGLADHFDLQVHPGAAPYQWTQALDETALREALARARPRLWGTGYDHAYWFFNTTGAGPPFHAGYALGFHLIRAYLDANPDHGPSDLAATPAQQILADPAVLEALAASRSPVAAPPGPGDAR